MDDEERQHLEDLLKTHRRRLRPLEKQAAQFGARTDPQVLNEIEDIRAEIARIETQLRNGELPAVLGSPAALEQLWKQALAAFFTNDWEEAMSLLTKVADVDPDYKEVRARLKEARRQVALRALYREIRKLRDDDQWQAVLGALDELDHRQPGYPDPEGLRVWAIGRERREQRYNEALAAYKRADWAAAVIMLEALLADAPSDADATALLAQARAEQQAAHEQERQSTQQVQSPLDQQPHKATGLVQSRDQRPQTSTNLISYAQVEGARVRIKEGDFATAFELLKGALTQSNTDPAAIWLISELIENPRVPLETRLQAGHMIPAAVDPRPGVCTLEPSWCGPFPAGQYPIAGGEVNVQLGTFEVARYPVTVWQFQQWVLRDDFNWTTLNQPAAGISWHKATAFCKWLTQQGRAQGWLREDQVIRLPSEEEWEVAAMWDLRQGRMRTWNPPAGEIWQNVRETHINRITPVGMFPDGASPCGALDMAGNVWEWCGSVYSHYLEKPGWRSFFRNHKVIRGGAYNEPNSNSGWHIRRSVGPLNTDIACGFRLCLSSSS